MVATCCVPGCKNRHTKESSLEFCRVPREEDVRSLWTRAIFKDENTKRKNYDRICGAHFITGMRSTDPSHPDYIPSVFPSTTSEEFRAMQQKYEVFRHEQEKSLLKLNSELSALNQLWQEKGWSQESIKKLLCDGYASSFQTPNQPTPNTPQVAPVFEPEQYLILDKGMGLGKMVVRLSRPVKYVTSSGLVESKKDPSTMDLKESSCGWYGYTEVPAKSTPLRIKTRRNKAVQFDSYIDIDDDQKMKEDIDEKKELNSNLVSECKETESFNCESTGEDSHVNHLSKIETATNSVRNYECVSMDCGSLNETGRERALNADRESKFVIGSRSVDNEIATSGTEERSEKKGSSEPKPLEECVPMECNTITDERNEAQNDAIDNMAKTDEKSSETERSSSSVETQIEDNKDKSERMESYSCVTNSEETHDGNVVQNSLGSSQSPGNVTDSLESGMANEDVTEKDTISEESFKEQTDSGNQKECERAHFSFALDHAYNQDEKTKKIEIKISKSYIPCQSTFLRCQDLCVERKTGSYKYYNEVVIDNQKLTNQIGLADTAVQTDPSDIFQLQVNMETERLTLMEEILWYHDRIDKRLYSMNSFENNPQKVQFYTGCANFETLKALFDYLISHIPTPPEQPKSYFEQFALTLMKLRLGLKMKDLGYQVNMSNARLSAFVTHWFDGLFCCLTPLVDWPKGKKLTLKFYQDKIQVLKRRYFILENVYDNLKTSDNWMIVKGVKDTVRVCDALSKFYVPGPDDDPETDVADVRDPFEVPEPVTADEESSSSSEEESADDDSEETNDNLEVPTKIAVTESESCFSEDNQEIQQMLDANISVKDMNMDTSLMGTSLMDAGLVDTSLATNAFSNYPGIDCGLSGSYSSMDTALIRQLGLDSVSTSRSGDSVFSNQPVLSNMESLFGMSPCGDSAMDPMDLGVNIQGEQSEHNDSVPVNVNTLQDTISLLAIRLKSDKKDTKCVSRRSSKSSPRKNVAESPQRMTTMSRALGDHSYIRNDTSVVESAFSMFPESVKNDHSYCFGSNQGHMDDTEMMDYTNDFEY